MAIIYGNIFVRHRVDYQSFTALLGRKVSDCCVYFLQNFFHFAYFLQKSIINHANGCMVFMQNELRRDCLPPSGVPLGGR